MLNEKPVTRYLLTDNKVLIATSIISAAGTLLFSALPVVFASLAKSVPFTEEQQGVLTGISGLGTLLVCATAFFWIPRTNWQRICGLALIPIFLGLVLIALAQQFYTLCAALFIFNAGAAVFFVMAMTILARAPDPSRAYGIRTIFEIGIASIVAFTITQFAEVHFGFNGFVGVLALFFVGSSFAIKYLPANFIALEGADMSIENLEAVPVTTNAKGWLSTAALFTQFATISAVWNFLGRIGEHNQIAPDQVGLVLSVAVFVAIFGAFATAIIGLRFGHLLPLLTGYLLTVLCLLALIVKGNLTIFFIAGGALAILLQYQSSYLMGMVASYDQNDKFTILMPLVVTLAVGIGAAIGGVVIERMGYTPFINGAILMILLSLVLTLLVLLPKKGIS